MEDYPALTERPKRNTIYLFDVDGTLTGPREVSICSRREFSATVNSIQVASLEVLSMLSSLRMMVAIGFVGGSSLKEQQRQLGSGSISVLSLFDYCFPENGTIAYRLDSFVLWLGEEKYKELVDFLLRYITDLELPFKRGEFIDCRSCTINVSPISRSASCEDRARFERYDEQHQVRRQFIKDLKEKFQSFSLRFAIKSFISSYSIGGQTSFDIFPRGWDKTYCLKQLEGKEEFSDGKIIHFFGDKTGEDGNDFEIYTDARVIGHKVNGPEDTMKTVEQVLKASY
ncbi:Phosphomannomutase [Hyphodiscus hymeniophilus]|uniref:Phosphomannomutase n=1 Tax=Hyphodiscus hymeniophilus TaxID=353542 RepID=A0A9P6VIZ8_9HELO|nr:Phosphomannomutase [Hyphodiscus hymeniophilus]